MFQDLRFGVRMLSKSLMLTMVAVLSLGLGNGSRFGLFPVPTRSTG
jgi:hypothetical protein